MDVDVSKISVSPSHWSFLICYLIKFLCLSKKKKKKVEADKKKKFID